MFGYIRACKPELKMKEYDRYRAVYCTLCRTMGREYGVFSRLTLSYDFTFLALLNMSLKNGCDPIEKKRCVCNPLKSCFYCKNDESFQMPAATAIIMFYYKLLDNIHDEKGVARLAYSVLKAVFSKAYKKAALKYPEIENTVFRYIEAQEKLEKECCGELDRAADPTATALSEIFMLCSDDCNQKRVLSRLGYCMGRYIYIIDAACDLEKDIKKGSFNCLKAEYNGNLKELYENNIMPRLYVCSNEGGKTFELLDIKKYGTILGNIIYLGLEDTLKKELTK